MPRFVPAEAYVTLGVSPSDDLITIRQSWRRQVRDIYPEVLHGVDTDAATRKLAKLNDAWDAMRWHHPDKSRNPARSQSCEDPRRPNRAHRPAPNQTRQTKARTAGSNVTQTVRPAAPEALQGFASARRAFTPESTRTLRQT